MANTTIPPKTYDFLEKSLPKTYVILYQKDQGRVTHVHKNIIPKLNQHQIIHAIDAHSNQYRDFINNDPIIKVKPNLHKWKWTIRGQVACTLSHICAWREIAKNQDPIAVVLEDDAYITYNFQNDLQKIIAELPPDFTFCYLYITPHKYQNATIPGKQYINRAYETFGTVGYLVSQKGVQDLLEDFKIIRQEIDQQIITKINQGWPGVFTAKEQIVKTIGQLDNDNKITPLRSNVWDSLYFTVYDLKTFALAKERDDSFRKNVTDNLFNYEVLDTVRPEEIIPYFQNMQITIDDKANLSQTEITRSLSHLKAWKTIIQKNMDDACIIEHNIITDHYFTMNSDQARQEVPDDYYLCYLTMPDKDHQDNEALHPPNTLYINYGYPCHLASGYLISKAGAQAILEEFRTLKAPFDQQLLTYFQAKEFKHCFVSRTPILKINPEVNITLTTTPELNLDLDPEDDCLPRIGPYVIGQDIDEIVCINLEERTDRRRAMIEEFKDYPFNFYTAVRHQDPVRGCLESHINVIKYAKAQGYKNILILEDDLKIVKDLKTVPKFPDDWDMIYLGGLCTHVIQWGDWIRGHIYCDQAYLINSRLFDKIIEEGWNYNGPLDKFYTGIIHPHYKCYIQRESYVIQTEGWSDIDTKHKWQNFKWPCVGEMFPIP